MELELFEKITFFFGPPTAIPPTLPPLLSIALVITLAAALAVALAFALAVAVALAIAIALAFAITLQRVCDLLKRRRAAETPSPLRSCPPSPMFALVVADEHHHCWHQ